MAIGSLQSPGVLANQIDLTTGVPAVATSEAAFAGVFPWGPIGVSVVLGQESDLVSRFLPPSASLTSGFPFNPETWFCVADFLSFSNYINVTRAATYFGNTITKNFVGNTTNLAVTANSDVVQVGNTTFLTVGQELFWSNAEVGLPDSLSAASPPVITSIVNSTAVTLSENATANLTAIEVTFRDYSSYVAVGQEVNDPQIDWEAQGVLNPNTYATIQGTFAEGTTWVARYLGGPGNSLYVSQCDTASQFSSSINLAPNVMINSVATGITATVGSNTLVVTITPANTANATQVTAANAIAGQVFLSIGLNDLIQTGNTMLGFQYLSVLNIGTVTNTGNVFSVTLGVNDNYKIGGNTTSTSLNRYWQYFNLFTQPPGTSTYVTNFGNSAATDEMHIVISDTLGVFTGNPGAVLEKYEAVSRATDAQRVDGGSNYYQSIINQGSKYIWCANPRTLAMPNTAAFITSSTASAPLNLQFYGGSSGLDETQVHLSALTIAYGTYASPEDFPNISLMITGKPRGLAVSSNTQLGNYILDNVVTVTGRQDMMCFVSPDKALMVNNPGFEAADIVAARLNMDYSSYEVIDTGYYYRYDQYNDLYWWVPMNGQIAGLCAQTDLTNAPWWSPAGFNRGHLKNVIRLAYNPKQADRDTLYNNDVNPVVTFPGSGTVLYGDKTGLGVQSAFNRINVQRLFIVLKKTISLMAKQFLFEFNDDFTRARFVAAVTPYLQQVQGQRGISDFIVVCDSTNNGPEIVMHNQFVASIGVKPAYSINFIYLNFVAVRNDVSFSSIFGANGSIG